MQPGRNRWLFLQKARVFLQKMAETFRYFSTPLNVQLRVRFGAVFVKPLMHVPNRARQNNEAPAEGTFGSRSTAPGARKRSQQSPGNQAHAKQRRGRSADESDRPQSAASRQQQPGGAHQHGDSRACVNRNVNACPQGQVLPTAQDEGTVQRVDPRGRQPKGQTPIPHTYIVSYGPEFCLTTVYLGTTAVHPG